MPLYHKDVFLPRKIRGLVPNGVKQIRYSNHTIEESRQDRYGSLKLPSSLDFDKIELIEVLTAGQKADKIIVRYSLGDGRDLCLALIGTEDKRTWFAKTVWCNLTSDNHKTLNPSVYVKGPK